MYLHLGMDYESIPKMVKAGECVFDPLGTAVHNPILSTKNGENNCVVNRIVKL